MLSLAATPFCLLIALASAGAGQASSYVAGEYSYDGDGRRVKRKVGTVETWQVYGLGGELIAEYAANTSYITPQKEYGYRNGQLLIMTTCGSGYGDPPTLHDNPLVFGETTVQARHRGVGAGLKTCVGE